MSGTARMWRLLSHRAMGRVFIPAMLFMLPSLSQAMTVSELQRQLETKVDAYRHDGNVTILKYKEVDLLMVADPSAGRMRIMAVVDSLNGKDAGHLLTLLEANFHSALDARYAISDGRIYAVFLHDLPSLQASQLSSAVDQVASLVMTYGSAYSSTGMTFQGLE